MARFERLALVLSLAPTACASEYTVLSRDQIHPSAATRVAAQNLTPSSMHNPQIAQHLAVGTEIYEQQLGLLKARRNEVRARRRTLNQLAIGTLAATAAGVAATSLVLDSSRGTEGLRGAGVASLSGIMLGSTFEILGATQEDPESVDAKIRYLDSLYNTMLERLRSVEAGDPAQGNAPQGELARVRAASVIEEFITQALRINVKG
jgi:hypothetical protein